MTFSEAERVVLDEALSDLLVYIQENVPYLSNTSSETITENTMAITTSKIKLQRIKTDKEQKFSLQETKVMYWATSMLRDDNREYLDTTSTSDPDRDTAIETEKICNRLMRFFRQQFSLAGYDIRDIFPNQ